MSSTIQEEQELEQAYQSTLQSLFEKLPMFTRIGAAAYKANLDNTIALCEALGNPQHKFKSIHIAGTNGKGSCSHMLAAVLQCSGRKTGLYTSPHISDFRERIKINGEEISRQWVVDFVKKMEPLFTRLEPSFFEVTVAMAFAYFAEQQVDVAVIEVGLGGLLDSTNIIVPELSVITNISMDHMNLLGNSLQEIASQKAGIIKEHIPVVIGETQVEVVNVFLTAAIQHQAQVFFADQIYAIPDKFILDGKQVMKVVNKSDLSITSMTVDLLGAYQAKNVQTVCCALDVLNALGWGISLKHREDGLASVQKLTGIKGRFHWLSSHPAFILDVSHNEAGLKELWLQVKQLQVDHIFVVLGFVKDKEVKKALSLCPKEATYYFTQAQIPRALPSAELGAMSKEAGLQGEVKESVTMALDQAFSVAKPNDLILVTGSFFILDEAYQYKPQKN